MSISSTASASEQPGFAIVSVKGYRLQTTIEIGEIDCAFKSCSSDGIDRARIPRKCTHGMNDCMWEAFEITYHREQRGGEF